MRSFIKLLAPCCALLIFSNCTAQIPNAKTATVQIYGNCGMCEKTIEKAAYIKGQVKADWDKDTKMALITFDSSLTSTDEVLRRIAVAGYDSDKFKATDTAYGQLPGCCQYERPKTAETSARTTAVPVAEGAVAETPMVAAPPVPAGQMVKKQVFAQPAVMTESPLADVYSAYFGLKNALVATDGTAAAERAKTLFSAIDQVKLDDLNAAQHPVWMKYQTKLSYDAEHIKGVTDTGHQREHFASLSKNMYEVMKVIKPEATVYYDHCPMYNDGKGGNWLSTEPGIKNPYYGKKMLACGSVTETLK